MYPAPACPHHYFWWCVCTLFYAWSLYLWLKVLVVVVYSIFTMDINSIALVIRTLNEFCLFSFVFLVWPFLFFWTHYCYELIMNSKLTQNKLNIISNMIVQYSFRSFQINSDQYFKSFQNKTKSSKWTKSDKIRLTERHRDQLCCSFVMCCIDEIMVFFIIYITLINWTN